MFYTGRPAHIVSILTHQTPQSISAVKDVLISGDAAQGGVGWSDIQGCFSPVTFSSG
jgi:hypothetical protein